MLKTKRKVRILDFDIENRPLSYWLEREPTAEITAIASCWIDDIGSMEVFLLGKHSPEEILNGFVARYNEADIVTGHYIRRHDLPIINGALMEYGMPQLSQKMTWDTKLDMHKKAGIPATQEYLSEILGVPFKKTNLTQYDWRRANRLTQDGLEATERRVTTDVYQHMLLRAKMLHQGLLSSPKMWRP